MRLIDADKLLKEIDTEYSANLINKESVLDRIADSDTVDTVPVVHAHWIYDRHFQRHVCSRCGNKIPTRWGKEKFKYCPMCGVRMDEDENSPDIQRRRDQTARCV